VASSQAQKYRCAATAVTAAAATAVHDSTQVAQSKLRHSSMFLQVNPHTPCSDGVAASHLPHIRWQAQRVWLAHTAVKSAHNAPCKKQQLLLKDDHVKSTITTQECTLSQMLVTCKNPAHVPPIKSKTVITVKQPAEA
jgi:hypothetical protein